MKDDREFWLQMRRGLLIVISAIETRWGFPRTSGGQHNITTLGTKPAASGSQTPQHPEPPAIRPLDSSQKEPG